MHSAATARSGSSSGKRGLPGGGATASGGRGVTAQIMLGGPPVRRRTLRSVHRTGTPRLERVRSFHARLAGIVLAGVGVRLIAAYFNRHYPVQGDALVYHAEARFLADGEGFRRYVTDVPTAEHPPLHILLLAAFDLLGAHSAAVQRALLGLVGSATVAVIGLLGRDVRDERTGLIAAAIAALYPMLWLADAALMSETTSMLLVALALLVAYKVRTTRTAALLGVVIGLGALTRGELIGLLGLLVLDRRRAWVTLLACALVLVPWTIRNALTFER